MAQEIETERPLVGKCLPLWDELRAKVKDWCSNFPHCRRRTGGEGEGCGQAHNPACDEGKRPILH
ncbi:uncharacterized protein Pyn_21909 [Prunus yedoensis var. nudiflora]|uniref:Uncharacterized protein n=1 Tax=Prunus yedoensis var. nudiflora TaxID=2094558 RepID=A0A314UJF6_PRUYE|nr:uncharacterized protein Pyn_21909 [Prunus yedoensis var. nudiflora]